MFAKNNLSQMKKLVYILVLVFAFSSLVSCAAKKKGCGLTADATQVPSQEVVVAEVSK